MGMRFVNFSPNYVNPSRVLFVKDVYGLGEINMSGVAPLKTGLPVAQVIKMLEDALSEPGANEPISAQIRTPVGV
jgi:hypothetical protein